MGNYWLCTKPKAPPTSYLGNLLFPAEKFKVTPCVDLICSDFDYHLYLHRHIHR